VSKPVVILSAMVLMAASFIAYLLLATPECASGTVHYESGPVKTCVPGNQTAFLACLGQVKSTFSKGGSDPAKGAFKVTLGELTFDLDIQGNKAIVPENSTIADPAALSQVEQCGRSNGLAIEHRNDGVAAADQHNVDAKVTNSHNVHMHIDNSERERSPTPPTKATIPDTTRLEE
jgi:hypothetical protein